MTIMLHYKPTNAQPTAIDRSKRAEIKVGQQS